MGNILFTAEEHRKLLSAFKVYTEICHGNVTYPQFIQMIYHDKEKGLITV